MAATKLVSVGPFHVSLKHEELCVVSIPPELVPKAAWWLVREYSLDQRDKGGAFNSVILDDDGLSIVCSPLSLSVLENLLQNNPNMIVSKQRWKAFIITVIGWELPGAVYYLADTLSREGMSILHISTFDSEVFLVQEQDVDRACAVLRKTENFKEMERELRMSKQEQRHSNNGDSKVFKEGFELKVLPGNFFLTKLADGASLSSCSAALTRLMLFDPRFSTLERVFSKARQEQPQGQSLMLGITNGRTKSNSRDRLANLAVEASASATAASFPPQPPPTQAQAPTSSGRPATFMWGLWQCGSELTLLLDEQDIEAFPEDALVVSPQRWKVVKLSGRAIEFDETGIVSAMTSSYDLEAGISLNISTATTNCSLVPDELLDQTLETLGAALGTR